MNQPTTAQFSRRSVLQGLVGAVLGTGLAVGGAAAIARSAPPTLGEKLIHHVSRKLGSPYVFGAEGEHAFDCSGLVQWGWDKVGIAVPRTADKQWRAARPLQHSQLRAGDSIFFINSQGIAKHTLLWAGDGTGNIWQASDRYAPCSCVMYGPMPHYTGRIEYGRLASY